MEVGESSRGRWEVGESSHRRRQRRKSKSVRADLVFPVGRIGRYLRKGRYAKRVGETAPVYMAAVMEYVAAEVLFMAGYKARNMKKKRITPRHIALVIRDDEDISKILTRVIIPHSGVPIEKPAEKKEKLEKPAEEEK